MREQAKEVTERVKTLVCAKKNQHVENTCIFQSHLAILGCISVHFILIQYIWHLLLTDNSQGLSIKQAEFAVKKYKSHRRIPARIMMDLEIMNL